MKFISKINKQYFWTLILLLIGISFIGYFILKGILEKELREDIFEKEFAIINEISSNGKLPNLYPIIETREIVKLKAQPKSFNTIYLYDNAEDENEPYIEYTNTVAINHHYYLIKLRHSLVENDELIIAIAIPLLILLILTFAISYILTKKMNKTIWKDFEHNLSEIENFSFNNKQTLVLKQTNIEEFDKLNVVIKTLSNKLQRDYETLKEFSENASHEIQTPLSIILMNLEELLQEDIPEEALKYVVKSINAVKRLSTLNKSLVLMTKIENGQFNTNAKTSVNDVTKEKIEEFTPLFKNNNIQLRLEEKGEFILNIEKQLVEILVNNLLSNAIKHNLSDGFIHITIEDSTLKICNSGEKNTLTNNTIFKRFIKENSPSYGLGLAIVKQLCNLSKSTITYSNYDNTHCFTLTKKENNKNKLL